MSIIWNYGFGIMDLELDHVFGIIMYLELSCIWNYHVFGITLEEASRVWNYLARKLLYKG